MKLNFSKNVNNCVFINLEYLQKNDKNFLQFLNTNYSLNMKQFLDILGVGETLIQQTFRRLLLICPKENIFVVTLIKISRLSFRKNN